MTMMLLKAEHFDNPLPGAPECQELEMKLLHEVSVADGGEYWLGELLKPLSLSGSTLPAEITHVIASPRLADTSLHGAPYGGRPVNIAYVVDQIAVSAPEVTQDHVHLAGFGLAAAIPTLKYEKTQKQSLFGRLGFGKKNK